MKIYTKTGDGGETSLLSGRRVKKSDARLDAYGTVDELNSVLGLALSAGGGADGGRLRRILVSTQHRLFTVGSHLACDDAAITSRLPALNEAWITELEQEIDFMDQSLPPLRQFILPGGSILAAHLHVARTVCRRAERLVAAVDESAGLASGGTSGTAGRYLNRLSDFLFVAARFANFTAGIKDLEWSKSDGSHIK
jgi:cob(I)alamin adenosyltransferase